MLVEWNNCPTVTPQLPHSYPTACFSLAFDPTSTLQATQQATQQVDR